MMVALRLVRTASVVTVVTEAVTGCKPAAVLLLTAVMHFLSQAKKPRALSMSL